MKILVKFSCMIIVVALLVTSFAFSAFARTGYYAGSSKLNSGKMKTNFSLNWSDNTNNYLHLGAVKTTWTGTSSTKWLGLNPHNADSIVHHNIIRCDKIGGNFSGTVSEKPSIGFSLNSDSTSIDYTYSVENAWKVEVDFTYSTKVGGLYYHQSQSFKSTATVKLGTSFYTTDTGW